MDPRETAAVVAFDGNGRQYNFLPEDVRWTSVNFWDRFTLDLDEWVHQLVALTRGCRITAMSLVLQTPTMICPHGEWIGLLRLPREITFTMTRLGRAIVSRPPDVFGYEVDTALTKMARLHGKGAYLHSDILYLYSTEPTPDVRRWFRRLFVETAPDDRLVQEAWHPGAHPVVKRGIALLHRLTGGGSREVLDQLLSVEVRCVTPEQDALVTQCRRAAGIVDMERPMKRTDVTVQSHAGEWEFKWYNVRVSFGDERVYERPDERLRWLAIWIACTFSTQPGFENILKRTPDALLTALLPAIKRTLTPRIDKTRKHDNKASAAKRQRRLRRQTRARELHNQAT